MQQNQPLSFPWQLLLDWYKEDGRHHLPWRDYTHPELGYRVWLAEILLQQTQVDRVIPFYTKILDRYPTIADLAQASYEEFFPYYQGLGYYSRARNILKAAKLVHEEYQGIFPREKKSLMTLPGVGGYTSSAILAFAYGEPYLSWDTNLEKVFARYYHGSKILKLSESEKDEIERDFRDFLSGSSEEQQVGVRAINNALMDFASTIDLKNPTSIDWDHHPIPHGLFYETRGDMEPKEEKRSISFPIPDATVVVILHQDHRVYYSDPSSSSGGRAPFPQSGIGSTLGVKDSGVSGFFLSSEGRENRNSYSPFILPPSLTRDTRRYVQDFFRVQYSLELSVRPIHKKWLSKDGKPYIAVNAQIQAGDASVFRTYSKSDMKTSIERLYSL